VSNSLARAPCSSACSTLANWAAGSLDRGPSDPTAKARHRPAQNGHARHGRSGGTRQARWQPRPECGPGRTRSAARSRRASRVARSSWVWDSGWSTSPDPHTASTQPSTHLPDVVVGCGVAVPGPGWASGAGLAAFGALTGWVVLAWMFGNPRRTRAGVRRPGAAGRSQRRRRSSANLRARRSWVWEAMASQSPAVGGLGGAELRAGPAQGLLEQSEGVLKIEPTEKRLPPAVDVGGGGAGARRPQPPRLGVTVAGRVVDLQADQRALDDGQLAVVVQPAGPVGEPGMQPVPAAGHRGAAAAHLRPAAAALPAARRSPPRPWPSASATYPGQPAERSAHLRPPSTRGRRLQPLHPAPRPTNSIPFPLSRWPHGRRLESCRS
jgi:hypothetical protein